MKDTRVRIGLIGSGMIAQVMHLPHLLSMPNLFDVVALCDISPGTVRGVADKHDIQRTSTDYRDMLEHVDLDAVMILTPNHARPAIAAAQAGKHVFVEKPMCNNLEEADELVDVVARNDVIGMVGYHKRYDPGYMAGCDAIQKLQGANLIRLHNAHGPNDPFLAHYDIMRVDDVDPVLKQRLRQEQVASLRQAIGEQPEHVTRAYGHMLGSSIHEMTILHGAFGLPERVVSTEIWSNGVAYASIMAYAGDLRCVFDVVYMPGLRKFDETLTVYSPSKVVSIAFPSPFLENAPTLVDTWEMDGESYRESQTVASYHEAFKLELIHFHACIVDNKTPRTPLSEGREDIALLIEMINAYRP